MRRPTRPPSHRFSARCEPRPRPPSRCSSSHMSAALSAPALPHVATPRVLHRPAPPSLAPAQRRWISPEEREARTNRCGGEESRPTGCRRGVFVVRYFIVNLFYFSNPSVYMNVSGIRPKAVYELVSRQVGGPLNLNYTCCDCKTYLRSKGHRELAFG